MWQKIKNLYHFVGALLAAIIFNFPSKNIIVIGVTGTDGKTTTVHMIYQVLKESGQKVSMVSTVGAAIGSKVFDTGFHVTTPTSWQIQKYLRRAVDAGHKYFVLETTSHGLDQNRLAFVNLEVGVLTNITHDHLDYHGTWEKYALAKTKLFKNVKISILNLDDEKSYEFLKNKSSGKIVTYALSKNSDVNLKNFPIKLQVPGQYNLQNALAANACAQELGIPKQKIKKALSEFAPVKGRMDQVSLGQHFKVYIDFAHTPNALDQALKTLKSQSADRLIAVFGAAGQRDKSKRELMGSVADAIADIIILTAEDPRTESVKEITSEISKGIKDKVEGKSLFIVEDRQQAIDHATRLASKNDIVGIFGKGHEKTMCYGKREIPWDEFEVTKKAIKRSFNAK